MNLLTDLQAYNEGHLVGKWIELPLTPFELQQALSEILTDVNSGVKIGSIEAA